MRPFAYLKLRRYGDNYGGQIVKTQRPVMHKWGEAQRRLAFYLALHIEDVALADAVEHVAQVDGFLFRPAFRLGVCASAILLAITLEPPRGRPRRLKLTGQWQRLSLLRSGPSRGVR